MYIEEITQDGTLQLNVEGNIDTINSPEFQDAVLKAFQKSNNVVINMEKVSYLASAGLRALMLGSKTASSKGGTLVVINVQQSVADVFRVTGFDKVLDIR
ncbi:MAG: STAS domain-containing protein [Lachnospiraceae bacterium]|nr:STAS domain-containing protein [Lachnospiraceae bacterium]